MASRYDNRDTALNDHKMYKNMFRNRGVRYINQYTFPELRHPTAEEVQELDTVGHIWKTGDRFFKLAHKYYGDPSMWWIIAWFNQKPTEGHMSTGETIFVPLPLEKILQFLGV